MENDKHISLKDYVIIKALETGVTVSSVSDENSDGQRPVRLDEGEIFIMRLISMSRGYKIRGQVEVHTCLGMIQGESRLIVES